MGVRAGVHAALRTHVRARPGGQTHFHQVSQGLAAERALSDRHYYNPAKEPEKGRRIAVIGAGPAG